MSLEMVCLTLRYCYFSLSSQNMSDAMAVLHKLQTGLDVNVKFTGVRVFEYTPECIVFDLLDIPLYHGWLVDPQVRDTLFSLHLPDTWIVFIPLLSVLHASMNTDVFHS